MSTCIEVYALPWDELASAIGSRDPVLLDLALHQPEPELGQALRALVEGAPLAREQASLYGYALRLLCGRLGEMLPNRAFCPIRWDYLERLDWLLERSGIAFRLGRFLCNAPPFGLPVPEDFPTLGHHLPEAVRATLADLTGRTVQGVTATDRDVLVELRGWLQRAASVGQGLVIFGA